MWFGLTHSGTDSPNPEGPAIPRIIQFVFYRYQILPTRSYNNPRNKFAPSFLSLTTSLRLPRLLNLAAPDLAALAFGVTARRTRVARAVVPSTTLGKSVEAANLFWKTRKMTYWASTNPTAIFLSDDSDDATAYPELVGDGHFEGLGYTCVRWHLIRTWRTWKDLIRLGLHCLFLLSEY